MIKVILSDLARTFLFVKDTSWTDTLNKLYAELESKKIEYDFWAYFELNFEYLELMKELKLEYNVNMYTSGYIQNHPKLNALLTPIFKNIFNEEKVGYKKTEIKSYEVIAKNLEVEPNEILFIDDDPRYGEAARNAGLQVFQMTNNQELKKYLQTLKIL